MLANKFQKYLINGGGSRGQNPLAQKEKRMSSYKSITQPILDLTDSKNRIMNNCKTIAMTFVIALVALMSQSAFADSEKAGRTTTYFHSNALGSIEAASDEQGQLLWRKHYQPFGTQVQGSDTEEATSFTGKQYDDKIGLSYFGARYYDPQLGRFTSPDPVSALAAVESNSAMFNRYAYANNNPYRYVDPDGRAPDLFTVATEILPQAGKSIAALVVYAEGVLTNNPHKMNAGVEAAREERGNNVNALGSLVSPPGTSKITKSVNKADKKTTKTTHGNSKTSTKQQHLYMIEDVDGNIKKVGVSGQKLNNNGTSPRANSQLKGGDKATVLESGIPGRTTVLQKEGQIVEGLKKAGHELPDNKRPKI